MHRCVCVCVCGVCDCVPVYLWLMPVPLPLPLPLLACARICVAYTCRCVLRCSVIARRAPCAVRLSSSRQYVLHASGSQHHCLIVSTFVLTTIAAVVCCTGPIISHAFLSVPSMASFFADEQPFANGALQNQRAAGGGAQANLLDPFRHSITLIQHVPVRAVAAPSHALLLASSHFVHACTKTSQSPQKKTRIVGAHCHWCGGPCVGELA